jgi:hypothetical protein
VGRGVEQHKQHMQYRGWEWGDHCHFSCFKLMLPHVAKLCHVAWRFGTLEGDTAVGVDKQ